MDNVAMADSAWRTRLEEAFKDSGKSKRALSLSIGKGPGYLHSILSEGKEPTIENLIDLCAALNVSAIYILYGFDVTPEETELLTKLRDNPDQRSAILSLLSVRAAAI